MKCIEELLAEAEIREIQMRYCRAADRTDFELLRNCFYPDAVICFSSFTGSVDAFIAMAKQSLAAYAVTTHFTGNYLIDVDGETARTEFYTRATHRLMADEKDPERDYVASVRYLDRMERRAGEWRIAERRCVLDWARTDPIPNYCDGPKR